MYAFLNCTSLKEVYYNGTEAEWNELEIGIDNECLLNATIYFTDKEYATVVVNYVMEDGAEPVKTVEIVGAVGENVVASEVYVNVDGTAYRGNSQLITVEAGGNVVNVPLVAAENAVYAKKTETYNSTLGRPMTYPAASDRPAELAGTDAMFSASWGDTRYGEMLFPVKISPERRLVAATLVFTVADWIDGYNQDFEIYIADPTMYGNGNTLSAVGSGRLGSKIGATVAVELNLDGVDVPNADEVMFIIKLTDGLGGVYGASFGELAPFMIYEVEESEVAGTYYEINSLKGELPKSGSFYAEVDVTKIAERDAVDAIVIAVYKDGVMIDRLYMKAKFENGQKVIFGGFLNATEGCELKAMVWDDLKTMVPLAKAKIN